MCRAGKAAQRRAHVRRLTRTFYVGFAALSPPCGKFGAKG
jgi:hypothetical protein